MHGALDPARVQVRLGSIVREVRWRRGAVTVEGSQRGRQFIVRASRAVITLPLGVLQSPDPATAVAFVPELTGKQSALQGLASGPVIKVVLRFRRAFWEALDEGRYRDAAFFGAPGAAFPTFWTTLPARTPLLTAWAAGPNAARLAGAREGEIVQHALASVDAMFGKRAKARAHLQGAYLHDWQADPFARGAYSYVVAGGSASRKILSRPLRGTLFFAGEAADVTGESGTVAGALNSGARAARQVLAAAGG
jgi:monoamine oxidase